MQGPPWRTGSWPPRTRLLPLPCVGAPLQCGTRASHCSLLLLQSTGSRARRLGHCAAWAQLPHGKRDLSSPARDQTHVPRSGRQVPNHRAPGKALRLQPVCSDRKKPTFQAWNHTQVPTWLPDVFPRSLCMPACV